MLSHNFLFHFLLLDVQRGALPLELVQRSLVGARLDEPVDEDVEALLAVLGQRGDTELAEVLHSPARLVRWARALVVDLAHMLLEDLFGRGASRERA